MKLSRIKIENFMGIESLELTPGKSLTVIEGGNDKQKTTIISAIKTAIGGSNNAQLIRHGQQQAEVVLTFDDGAELSRKLRTGKDPIVSMRDAEGKAVTRPASALAALVDKLSFNPVAIMSMDAGERTNALLKSIPMDLNIEKLSELTDGRDWKELTYVNAIEALDRAHDIIYQERVPNNIAVEQCQRTIQTLSRTVADEDEPIKDADLGKLTSERERVNVELRTIDQKIDALLAEERERIRLASQKAMEDVDHEINILEVQLATLKGKRKAILAKVDSDIQATVAEAEAARQRGRSKYELERQAIDSKIVAMRAAMKEQERTRYARQEIENTRQRLDEAKRVADLQSNYLKAIERMKAGLLANLPIKGLTVEKGEIFIDGTPFDMVNKAGQIKFCLSVAKIRAGELPLVLVDGMEQIDEESWPMFAEAAERSGLQLVVTRVTSGPRSISTK